MHGKVLYNSPGKTIGVDGIDEKAREPASKWGFESIHKLEQVSRETWLAEMQSRRWRDICSQTWGNNYYDPLNYAGKHDKLGYKSAGELVSAVYYEGTGLKFVAYYYLAPKNAVRDDYSNVGATYTNQASQTINQLEAI
jgi:hypothetical protein